MVTLAPYFRIQIVSSQISCVLGDDRSLQVYVQSFARAISEDSKESRVLATRNSYTFVFYILSWLSSSLIPT
jgi:hypothetical protein